MDEESIILKSEDSMEKAGILEITLGYEEFVGFEFTILGPSRAKNLALGVPKSEENAGMLLRVFMSIFTFFWKRLKLFTFSGHKVFSLFGLLPRKERGDRATVNVKSQLKWSASADQSDLLLTD